MRKCPYTRVRWAVAVAAYFAVTLVAGAMSGIVASSAEAQPPGGIVHPDERGLSSAQLGAELYSANCAACHGEQGEGVRERDPDSVGGAVGQGPPLIGVGELSPDFYLRSGRMPLGSPDESPHRTRPYFSEREIEALVEHVGDFGEGPQIPDPDPAFGELTRGKALFAEHCAGCHQMAGQGGYATGARVPPLQGLSARDVAEAVRIGPYVMPKFPQSQISDAELDRITAYVLSTNRLEDEGGLGLGHIGPVPEGLVAWIVGAVVLVSVCMVIGRRLKP